MTFNTAEQSFEGRRVTCQKESRGQHRLEKRRKECHHQRHYRPRKRCGKCQCLRDTGRRSAKKSASTRRERQGVQKTRIRFSIQMELEASKNECKGLLRCPYCMVNNCPEEYCPPTSILIPPD